MLQSRTGIWPLVRLHHQTGSNRVFLNVGCHLFKFTTIPDPVIKGLVLPKRLPRTPQYCVGLTRGLPLDHPSDLGQFDAGRDEYVHVIWHDHEGVHLIFASNRGVPKAIYNALSNFRLA